MEEVNADVAAPDSDHGGLLSGSGSTEQLQRSLHALLERRGVMQELRAQLRSHVIALIRNAQQGKPLVCNTLQTQRLELKFQALNILITEYLLRQEFNYTVSVFTSEIPLDSMVFHYAQTLQDRSGHEDATEARFDEHDVLQIINILGVQSNSEQANQIVETYKSSPQRPPLLVCILHSIRQHTDIKLDTGHEKKESSNNNKDAKENCSHSNFCDICRSKRKIETEDKKFAEDLSNYCALNLNMERFDAERDFQDSTDVGNDFIEEMFQELRSVYEAENAMLRSTQDSRLQQSLASHRIQLRMKEKELEEEYRARVDAKERKIEERKNVLWQLARKLREQHTELTGAMQAVHVEREQLHQREENLQEQLKNAENLLKRNGDEMRNELNRELKILEQHISAMKEERDKICQERTELEKLKMSLPNQSDEAKTEYEQQRKKNVDLQRNYDLLRDELSIVQNYIASTKNAERKHVAESSSLTDICGLNNNFSTIEPVEKNDGNSSVILFEAKSAASLPVYEKDTMNNSSARNLSKSQLINDLKKLKNFNYRNDIVVQMNVEASNDQAREHACDNKPGSEQTDRMMQELMMQLRDDNSSLRQFSNQQQEHISSLVMEQAKLRAQLTSAQHTIDNLTRLSAIAAPVAVHSTSHYSAERRLWPQVRRPMTNRGTIVATTEFQGEDVPLIKNIGADINSNVDARRCRQNVSGNSRLPSHPTTSALRDSNCSDTPVAQYAPTRPARYPLVAPSTHSHDHRTSHNNLFREPDYSNYPEVDLPTSGATSPTDDILADAKLRLRKLEIEAEVVEQSYLDFRRRHSADSSMHILSASDKLPSQIPSHLASQSVEYTSKPPLQKNWQYTGIRYLKNVCKVGSKDEFKKYISDYRAMKSKIPSYQNNIPQSFHSSSRQSAINHPSTTFKSIIKDNQYVNNESEHTGKLVEKPLIEFRKLYHLNKPLSPTTHIHKALRELRCKDIPKQKTSNYSTNTPDLVLPFTDRQDQSANVKQRRKLTEDELEILKSNVQKLYNKHGAPKVQKQEIVNKFNVVLINDNAVSEDPDNKMGPNNIMNKTEVDADPGVKFALDKSTSEAENTSNKIVSSDQLKNLQGIMKNSEEINDGKECFIKNSTNEKTSENVDFKLDLTNDALKTADPNMQGIVSKDSEHDVQEPMSRDFQKIITQSYNTLPYPVSETVPQIARPCTKPEKNEVALVSNDREYNKITTNDDTQLITENSQENVNEHIQNTDKDQITTDREDSEILVQDNIDAVFIHDKKTQTSKKIVPKFILGTVDSIVEDVSAIIEDIDNVVEVQSPKKSFADNIVKSDIGATKTIQEFSTDDTAGKNIKENYIHVTSSDNVASSKGSSTKTDYVLPQELERVYSSEELSGDIGNNETDKSSSAISVGKSESDSFWG